MLVTKSNSTASAAILTIVMLTAFIVTIDGCSRSEDPGKLMYNFNNKSLKRLNHTITNYLIKRNILSRALCVN